MNSHHKRLRRRALVRRVVVALALGAALQTLVAWGAAIQQARLWMNPSLPAQAVTSYVFDGSSFWGTGVRLRGAGITVYRLHPPLPESGMRGLRESALDPVAPQRRVSLFIEELPSYVRPPDPDMAQAWSVMASGWPFRSMSAADLWVWRDASRSTARQVQLGMRRDGLMFGEFTPRWLIGATSPARYSTLPLNPVWTGLVANTVLYGAALLGTIAGALAILRRWRIGRGRCGACGYDLQGAESGECPECGISASNPQVARGE